MQQKINPAHFSRRCAKSAVAGYSKRCRTKAIGLYSGGLDSILAIQIILEAANSDIEIIPVRFITAFFDYKNDDEFKKEAKYLKDKFDLQLRAVDITDDYLKILEHPKFGYGKNLNPCIDCKILMLKKAKKIMRKEKADFIFTGEVIGQRPKSQRMDAMRIIEREAGLDGYLVRPLSAKLLKETMPEKDRLLTREKLLGLNGRGRSAQFELAKKYNIQYFATPSGGCLLTDEEYARKLKIIKNKIGIEEHLLKFLNKGRVFIIDNKLFIVGRNDLENKQLFYLASKKDLLFQPQKITGPLCVFLSNSKVSTYLEDNKKIKILAGICARLSLKGKNTDIKGKIKIQYGFKDKNIDKMEELVLSEETKIAPVTEKELLSHKI